MLVNLMTLAKSFRPVVANEEGQDLAEYALVLVFIAIIAIAGVTALGTSISDIFGQITTGLSS